MVRHIVRLLLALTVAASVLAALGATSYAVSPALIPVQGALTDGTGQAVEGPLDVTFALYSDAMGTTTVWSETQTVEFEGGAFVAYLGTVAVLDLGLFRDYASVYLGVTVGSDAEMPLVRLATAPFAGYASFCGEASALQASATELLFSDFEARIGDATHTRYTDAEAVAAMGALSDTNPLNHNRFGPSDAVSAMGALGNANPLNHSRYTDAEAVAAMGAATTVSVGGVTVGAGTVTGLSAPSNASDAATKSYVDTHNPYLVCSNVMTVAARDYPTLNGQLDADYTGEGVCGAGWHVCNYQEATLYGTMGRCDLGGATWIVGGFSNTEFHRRSLWNGQDSVQCAAGNYPQWWNKWGPYYGRIHCAGGAVSAPVACCVNL